MKKLLLSIALLSLAACNSVMSVDIYIADLVELEAGENLTTRALFGLYLPSQDDCAEYRQDYQNIFRKSKGFQDMEYVRCYSVEYDDFVEFAMDIPLRMGDPAAAAMEGPIEVVVHSEVESGTRGLYLRSNPEALCDLDELVLDKFYTRLDLSEVSPRITITNDLRQSQTLVFSHLFVDGDPVLDPAAFELERRDVVNIALSDVMSAWIFDRVCEGRTRTVRIATWITDGEA